MLNPLFRRFSGWPGDRWTAHDSQSVRSIIWTLMKLRSRTIIEETETYGQIKTDSSRGFSSGRVHGAASLECEQAGPGFARPRSDYLRHRPRRAGYPP